MTNKLISNFQAPDFELLDTTARSIQLSKFCGKSVVLVLTRGFV